MDKRLSAAAIAAAFAMGLGTGTMVTGEPDPMAPRPDIATEQLLKHVSDDCEGRLRRHDPNPACRIALATVKGKQETGWMCNGAWMPQAVQECLDQAMEAATTK